MTDTTRQALLWKRDRDRLLAAQHRAKAAVHADVAAELDASAARATSLLERMDCEWRRLSDIDNLYDNIKEMK